MVDMMESSDNGTCEGIDSPSNMLNVPGVGHVHIASILKDAFGQHAGSSNDRLRRIRGFSKVFKQKSSTTFFVW